MGFNTLPGNPFPPSSEQENGTPYTLPIAGAETLGGVMVGDGLAINAETGVLSNENPTPYTLPIAGADTLGGVMVGEGLSVDAETGELTNNNPTPYAPPAFSTSEVDTRLKWIDGKAIYCKVVQTIITTSAAVAGDIKSGTVSLSGLIPEHDHVWLDVVMSNYLDTNNNSKGFVGGYYDEGGDELLLLTFFARANATANLVLKYTKATPTP